MKQTVYLFDFDGTITTKDTLIEVIRYAVGTPRLLLGFLLFSPVLVLMKLHLYPNWKAKQRVFSYFFKGKTIEEFNQLCHDFASESRQLLRPKALKAIAEAKEKGQIYVVSASIDNWVQPFLPDVKVAGTQVEVLNGRLTGRFTTPNCYGQEKVNRIQNISLNIERNRQMREMDKATAEATVKCSTMPMKPIISRLDPNRRQQLGEVFRFALVGGIATLIQYGVYLLMLYAVSPTLANTIGYAVSFLFNFLASTRYTFKVKTNVRHGAGFALSHLINYGLQILMLHLFIAVGFSEKLAPIPMFCVCVPVNFLLVRFFLKR